MSDDHDFEYMPGVPHPLPQGEQLLWQGRQRAFPLARRAFRCNVVLGYFALVWMLLSGREVMAGTPVFEALLSYQWLIMPAAGAWLLLVGMAWLFARSTIYSITSERVLIRSGVALPITIDVPLTLVDTVGLALHGDGSGDLALGLNKKQRASYFVLWPNVRPWHFVRPQPTLRALRYPEAAADALSKAMLFEQRSAVEPGIPTQMGIPSGVKTPPRQSVADASPNSVGLTA